MPPPLEGVAEEAPKQEGQSEEEAAAAAKGKRPKVQ